MSESFERIEKKYLLSKSQYEDILSKIADYVVPDKFFKTDIRSIYFDNDRFEMIRRSIEKPEYKEKIRIRSYGEPKPDDVVFVEFKKKLDGIVYKRRTKAKYKDVFNDISKTQFEDEQIGREIMYALEHYQKVVPAVFIGCKRTSYSSKEDKKLRITFDSDICYRMNNLSLHGRKTDKPVTDKTIMEIKAYQAYPLWLVKILDEAQAYPRGFSKVGTAFINEIKEKKTV